MTQSQAAEKAADMLASGQFDKASAVPDLANPGQWIVQARTAGPIVEEINQRT